MRAVAWVYVLLTDDGKHYVGSTTRLEKRMREHAAGHGSFFTKFGRPLKLLHIEPFYSIPEARTREGKLKTLPRILRDHAVGCPTCGELNAQDHTTLINLLNRGVFHLQ